MGLGQINLLPVTLIQAATKWENLQGKDSILGNLVQYMLVTFIKANVMAKVSGANLVTQMQINSLVILKMI